jgi:hypothetical protein
VKGRETLDHRDADGAIEARRFDAAGGRLTHRVEPPLDQRILIRPQLGHRSVDVAEDEAFPIGAALPRRRWLPPAPMSTVLALQKWCKRNAVRRRRGAIRAMRKAVADE